MGFYLMDGFFFNFLFTKEDPNLRVDLPIVFTPWAGC